MGGYTCTILTIVILGAGLYLSAIRGSELPSGLLPEEDTSAIFVVGSFPQGTAVNTTDAWLKTFIEEVNQIPGTNNSIEVAGYNMLTNVAEMSSFLILLALDPMVDRELSDADITDRINEMLYEDGAPTALRLSRLLSLN